MPAPERIRVLVTDDSATARSALVAVLARDPRIEVVGEARDGNEAISLARKLRPHVITMDVLMPGIDGLAAAETIMTEAPSRILVVSSAAADRERNLAVRSLKAGALELIAKPELSDARSLERWGRELAETIRIMAEIPVITRRRGLTPIRPATASTSLQRRSVDVFAIVASTGGPPALARIFEALPVDLPIPILVAQHIAQGFGEGLARWLGEVGKLRVILATNGLPALPGRIYLAPDSADLEVDKEGILRVVANPGRGPCPSGDRLLSSIARTYGRRAAAIVLTGMGEDGAQGLLDMRRAGGCTFAQDEQSCVVWGMPAAAQRVGAAEDVLPLAAVADVIVELSAPPQGRTPNVKWGKK